MARTPKVSNYHLQMIFNDCPEMEDIYEVFTEATYGLCFSLLMQPVHLVHTD